MQLGFLARPDLYGAIEGSLQRYPVTALIGPRQCGKTELARLFASDPKNRFDVESPLDLARLQPDPYGLLAGLTGVVVIDEIQLCPELFGHLRVIVDEPICRARFLVTGSASPDLINHTAETLAGRVHFIDMSGFDLSEVGFTQWQPLWVRGSFPRSFLAQDDAGSREWREDFLKTYVMRDIQRLAGGGLRPQVLARLLQLIAHFHGQFVNANEIAASLEVDIKTVHRYMDILTGAYLVRLVPPWTPNVRKRIRKAHRLYVRDSGLLHTLLRISDLQSLRNHDRCGASWEGFAMEQVLRLLRKENDSFFWRTHAGAEIDLIVPFAKGPVGFEFKVSSSPSVSRGIYETIDELGLRKAFVIYPGENEFALAENVVAVPIHRLSTVLNDPVVAP